MNLRSGGTVGAGILSSSHKTQFEEGAHVILSKWTALQLAVEQEWGGRDSAEKGEDLRDEVIDWFYMRKEHFVDELEPLLETIMLEDFNVQAEDGSPREVAQSLVLWYSQCLHGDFSMIERLSTVQPGAQRSTGRMVDNDGAEMDLESSSSDSEVDGAQPHAAVGAGAPSGSTGAAMDLEAPVIDSDGFQLVQRGRRRR